MGYTVLITGGAGFIGSNLAIRFKEDFNDIRVIAVDNLRRRGSELNLSRLRAHSVEFYHGDIRIREDLNIPDKVDLILECSADPSVLAGYDGSPEYVIQANLLGTVNCLELARRNGCDFIFLSSSRVYPFRALNSLEMIEMTTRYELVDPQSFKGASARGITEDFPLEGPRSLYGATKLASELIIQEYMEMYGLRALINRCGVIAGPWQMAKIDQGFVGLWVAMHVFGAPLSYVGFGGSGKQVRDVLHVQDLYKLLRLQLNDLDKLSGEVFNVGGGREISVSLGELTLLCQQVTGKHVDICSVPETRPADIRVYLSDCTRVRARTGWSPTVGLTEIVSEVSNWVVDHRDLLEGVLRNS